MVAKSEAAGRTTGRRDAPVAASRGGESATTTRGGTTRGGKSPAVPTGKSPAATSHNGKAPPRRPRSGGAGRASRSDPGRASRPDALPYPKDELLEDYRLACVSRALDDREITLQKQSRVFFQISGAGHEALLLGLARSLRSGRDWFFPYYRDRALMLGLGLSPYEILLEAVGSADDPASGGRQMPCHFGSRRHHVVTQSSPTGSQCLPAVGCAEATRYASRRPQLPGVEATGDELTYVSLGEGATSEGEFWESLNTACTLALPILYVVADNGYAISVPASEQAPAPISELVSGFRGLGVDRIDGRDYLEARRVGAASIERIRAGEGPRLLHAIVTRPYSHSSADTQSKYRSKADLADEASHDPLVTMAAMLEELGVAGASELAEIRAAAAAEVAEAAARALAAPRPDPASATLHLWDLSRVTEPAVVEPVAPGTAAAEPVRARAKRGELDEAGIGEVVALGEAIRRTLAEVMAADERVRVFGEDVADAREALLAEVEGKGGVFGTTHGLQRRFGLARCYNTPLAEANIIGRAVGQAVRGLHPCPEIQFFDYIWPAMQQLRSEAATIRWRSNGAFSCPMVVRVPIGGYLTGGAIWHSQSGESIFTHVPGILVAFPSRAADAAGLLRTAFRADDPVLFLEHKHLLRQPYTRDPFPGPEHLVPFGKARRVRAGEDLAIVTYGATVEKSRQAAELLAEEGIEVEIVDLRTLAPFDHDAVAEAVRRTSRLLVVHEDVLTSGFGAEVAAWAADNCFADLDAPVRRVGALDTPVGYEPGLERAILPQVEDIARAARDLAAW
jgi:2-oxoisovalerate dehydrogenase E1 component